VALPAREPLTPADGAQLSRRAVLWRQSRSLIRAVRDGDEATVEAAILELSRSRRIFAPLVFAVGALVMLFHGLKLLFINWRLTLIQILPAMWIWVAMMDLKAHVFHGHEFRSWSSAEAVALVVAVTVVTMASFYLNAIFAFAISAPGPPKIRPAFVLVRSQRVVVLSVGAVVGLALGLSTIVVPQFGQRWFVLATGIVVAVMMVTYVSIPARLVGVRPTGSRRDKLAAAAVGGALGAFVSTPPYVIGRIGILLLGSNSLFVLGVVLTAVGLALEVGATGAVKAIKMSAKLLTGNVEPRAA
jgi:hypothetical protein